MPKEQRETKAGFFKKLLKADITSVLCVLIGMALLMRILKPGFLAIGNISVIAQAFSITAIVGLSQMVIIGTGGMNLAVGAIGGLAGVMAGGAMSALGLPTFLSILIGLLIGGVCGLFNGYFITRGGCTGVSAFLVTLATGSLFTGITIGVTKATPFYNLDEAFVAFGSGTFLQMPLIMYAMLLIAAIVWFIFKYLGIGRRILAMGSNMHAAELYGVSIKKTVLVAHTMSGILAAAAGILLVARIGSAQTDIGTDWMLYSFAAPIIGGTRQQGGKVNVPGVVLGAIVLSLINNALVHLTIDAYWMTFIQGAIIISAVAFDRLRYIKKAK